MFGDSYFDFWPRHLVAKGYSNFYLDGYSGRDSANALLSLETCLQYATPKMIVWFMGMNDPDEAGISRSWEAACYTLAELCHRHGITLVLSTVPNVPERSHRYKNAYIRSNGLRYIDLCQGLSAEDSDFWSPGLLGQDNVHPTEGLGTAAIVRCMTHNLPEILKR